MNKVIWYFIAVGAVAVAFIWIEAFTPPKTYTAENIILLKTINREDAITGTVVKAPEPIDRKKQIGIVVVKLDLSVRVNHRDGMDLYGALVPMGENLSVGDKVLLNYLHIYERPRDAYLHIRMAEKL